MESNLISIGNRCNIYYFNDKTCNNRGEMVI